MKEFSLFTNNKFYPLFWTQFCGAFNDNVYKIALILLVTLQADDYMLWGFDRPQITYIAMGVFILPFFLFSALAGQLADKYDKGFLIRRIKFIEIIIMTMGLIAFINNNIGFLIVVLFFMGTQSTFFGPLKYSLLPQHLPTTALTAANGLIEMATFLAILLGTLFGGILITLKAGGAIIIGMTVVTIAMIGWATSQKIPDAPPPDATLKIRFNIFTQTFKQIRFAARFKELFIVIIGISWFWHLGATIMMLLPMMSKTDFKTVEVLSTVFLTFLSIGIGIGSVLCDKLISGKASNHLIIIGALGVSIFGADLYFSSQHIISMLPQVPIGEQLTLSQFFSNFHAYRFVIDLLLFGICAGFYIVPLYVILQLRSKAAYRSRIIAVNNIVNAIFMVFSVLFVMLLNYFSFGSPAVILTNSFINLFVVAIIVYLMPEFWHDFTNYFKRKTATKSP